MSPKTLIQMMGLMCPNGSITTMENMNFFVILSMDFHMVVNQYPRLSPILYEQYCNIATFKVDFHRVYIKARKDPMETQHPLPYSVTEYDLLAVIQQWSVKWMTPTIDDTKAIGRTMQHTSLSGIEKGKEVEDYLQFRFPLVSLVLISSLLPILNPLEKYPVTTIEDKTNQSIRSIEYK